MSSKSSRAPPNLEVTLQISGPAIPAQHVLPHSSSHIPMWMKQDHSQEPPHIPRGTCSAHWSWHSHPLESPSLPVTILSKINTKRFFLQLDFLYCSSCKCDTFFALPWCVHFVFAAVTNYHKKCVKITQIYSNWFWRSEVQNESY